MTTDINEFTRALVDEVSIHLLKGLPELNNAVRVGAVCGLRTVAAAVADAVRHLPQTTAYANIAAIELQLYQQYDAYAASGGGVNIPQAIICKEDAELDAIVRKDRGEQRFIVSIVANEPLTVDDVAKYVQHQFGVVSCEVIDAAAPTKKTNTAQPKNSTTSDDGCPF